MEGSKNGDNRRDKLPIIVTNFDSDESETEIDHEEASDTDDTFSVEELENALFTELEDGGRDTNIPGLTSHFQLQTMWRSWSPSLREIFLWVGLTVRMFMKMMNWRTKKMRSPVSC